jgi:Flp pilus assembly protein TadD
MAVRSEIAAHTACKRGAAGHGPGHRQEIAKNGQMKMIRAMTVSAILGALVAGVAAYTVSPSLWQAAMGLRSGGPEQTADAFEEWPICTMTVAMPEADWAKLDPEFAAGKKALAAEDWNRAIAVLKSAALRDPRNADIQNYIGYAYRRLRQMGPAIGHYQQALMLNPRHRSAHEHLGEAHLVLGDPATAEQHLAHLEDICLIGCEEYDDLKRAIAGYKRLVAR